MENSPQPACHCCGGTNLKTRFVVADPPSRRGEARECRNCGVLNFFPAHFEEAYAEEYYGEGDAKFQGVSGRIRAWSARNRSMRAHRQAGHAGACFDIGCGDGDFLVAMQNLGWQVSGCELPGPAFRRASTLLPGRISDRPDFHHLPDESFDLISLWQVFEHLPEPRETLKNVRRLLKPGGVLIVAVPNPASWQARLGGADWLHLDPPRHLHLASPTQLSALLEGCGFAVSRRHNPWFEFGIVGVIQTVFNQIGLPRDQLLDYLRANWRGASMACRFSYLAGVGTLLGPATAFAAMEALCGYPATYELWAVRKSERP